MFPSWRRKKEPWKDGVKKWHLGWTLKEEKDLKQREHHEQRAHVLHAAWQENHTGLCEMMVDKTEKT